MAKFLDASLGKSFWGMSKRPGVALDFSSIPSVTGVLTHHANFGDADGHVDLWKKGTCLYDCPPPDLGRASSPISPSVEGHSR
jgi:hypothetical protein